MKCVNRFASKMLPLVVLFLAVGCNIDSADLQNASENPFLDIKSSSVENLDEQDLEAINLALGRLGIVHDGPYAHIKTNDYQRVNVSKRLYLFLKKQVNNGNRMVQNHNSTMPLTKGLYEVHAENCQTDCVGYALYGMGASQTEALTYIHQNFPSGVPSSSLDSVVEHFFPNYKITGAPSQTEYWNNIPQPLIWFIVSDGGGHAVNAKGYYKSSDVVLYIDYCSNNSGVVSGITSFYFPN